MLSHLALSWHLPPALFILCTMPYFWMTARYAALVYWLPRSECTMALYLLYPAVQRVDRNLQLLCCCFCWSKVFGELDRLHFVFLVVSFIFPFFYFIPLWLTCQVCYIGSKSTSLSTPIGVKVTCFLAFYAFETIPAFIKSCISCRFGITFNAPFLVVISDAPAFAKYSNSRSCSFVSLSASCSNT